MKTWLTLLATALLVSASAQPQIEWQNGVMVQTVGKSVIYIFPSTQGRIVSVENPAGKITIGDTITIAYALKIVRIGKARFVGFDASQLPSIEQMKPRLSVEKNPGKNFGFIVRDANVPTLDIYIKPSFMEEKAVEGANTEQEKIARQGNLTVTLGAVGGKVKILSASLD